MLHNDDHGQMEKITFNLQLQANDVEKNWRKLILFKDMDSAHSII